MIGAWEKAAPIGAGDETGTGTGTGTGGQSSHLVRYLEERLSLRPAAAEESGRGGKGKKGGKGKGKDGNGDADRAENHVFVVAKVVGALLSSSSARVAAALAAAVARLPADTLRQIAFSGQQVSEPDLPRSGPSHPASP